jgi:F-type H+-transporting ATPase subunit b
MQAFVAMILTQAIGFFILYLILRKFAFGPVLNTIESRRDHIAGELQSLEKGRAELAETQRAYEQRLAHIEEEARLKVRNAVREGQEIKTQAQRETRDLLDKTRGLIETEKAKAAVEIRDQIVDLAVTAAEKLIREHLNDAKHRELVRRFIEDMPTAQG